MRHSILRASLMACVLSALAVACSANPTPTPTPGQPVSTPTPPPSADVHAEAGRTFRVAQGRSALVSPANLYIEALEVDGASNTATLRLTSMGGPPAEVEVAASRPAQYGGYSIALTGVQGSDAELQVNAGEEVVAANLRFAFDLLQELNEAGDGNLIFSPLSVSLALTMAYNGADGETKAAMEEALRLAGLDIDTVNAGNATLLAALAGRGPELQLAVANSLWAREGVPFEDDFFQRLTQYFNAEVESLEFDDEAKGRINAWVSEATNGKIDSILNEIRPDEFLFLINAIYLKAAWEYQFPDSATQNAPFHNANGSESTVPMMHQVDDHRRYHHLDGDGFQSLRLRYEGGASMYLFLPDASSDLDEFMDGLNAASWSEWMGGYTMQNGRVAMPKFKLEYEAELKGPLSNMGMGLAFTDSADFSKMTPAQAAISRVKHKAIIEVNEAGTEAAAVTMVGMTLTSMPQITFEFRADRPFFYAIVDDITGSVLFMGTVTEL